MSRKLVAAPQDSAGGQAAVKGPRHFPESKPSHAELRAIRRGRQAFARGQYVPLDELVQDVNNEARRKKSPSRAEESEPRP